MTVNSKNIFMGAYAERRQQNSLFQPKALIEEKERQIAITGKLKEAMQGLERGNSSSFKVSISQKNIDFLCSEAGYEKMRKDTEDLYIKNAMHQKELAENHPNDIFWKNTGNQWLIFSEQLYQDGFYEDMTDEEVKQAENLLAKITAGMDHLSRSMYQTGIEFSDYYGHGSNYFMSSGEVILELESATQALTYFGQNYVASDKQEAFQGLIGQFYQHNVEIISGYQSPVESFNKAVHAMHTGQYSNSQILSVYGQAMKNNSTGIQASIYLGGVSHSANLQAQYTSDLSKLFDVLGGTGKEFSDLWEQIEETLVDYTTNKSSNQEIRAYVLEQAGHTFQRIQNYWNELHQA